MKLPTLTTSLLIAGLAFGSTAVMADDYVIDTKGAHASIKFRVQHLGFSWLYGRFNEFSGNFSYDEKQPENASIEVATPQYIAVLGRFRLWCGSGFFLQMAREL